MGVPVPAVETGIAVSAIVLGLMVAAAARPNIWVAAVIVGIFAIFHGHAHGTELPGAANPIAYSLGFVIATGMLHLAGIAFGALAQWPAGKMLVRAGGRRDRAGGRGIPDRDHMSRRLVYCALLLAPTAALAHSPIKDIGAFYGGLLHPLFIPPHVLLLGALGLDARAAAAGRKQASTADVPCLRGCRPHYRRAFERR